jgi:hypothetical protein
MFILDGMNAVDHVQPIHIQDKEESATVYR